MTTDQFIRYGISSIRFRFLATLEVDPKHRYNVYHFSLVYGFSTAAGFLLLTLLIKLVYFLLQTWV